MTTILWVSSKLLLDVTEDPYDNERRVGGLANLSKEEDSYDIARTIGELANLPSSNRGAAGSLHSYPSSGSELCQGTCGSYTVECRPDGCSEKDPRSGDDRQCGHCLLGRKSYSMNIGGKFQMKIPLCPWCKKPMRFLLDHGDLTEHEVFCDSCSNKVLIDSTTVIDVSAKKVLPMVSERRN